jgi:hypothetical protein
MNKYPERIPEGITSIDTFPFSFSSGKNAKRNLENQLEQINSRVEKIIEHFTFNDIPIVHFVLKATNQKSDLKKLSKAIDRLADLVQVQEELSNKLAVINALEADPVWFTSTFSDYSAEIDRDLSDIIDNH